MLVAMLFFLVLLHVLKLAVAVVELERQEQMLINQDLQLLMVEQVELEVRIQ